MIGGLSLRARLLAGLGFGVVLLVLVALSVTSLTRRHLMDQVDERLDAAVRSRQLVVGAFEQVGSGPDVDPGPGDDPRPLSEFWEGYFTPGGVLRVQRRPNYGQSS